MKLKSPGTIKASKAIKNSKKKKRRKEEKPVVTEDTCSNKRNKTEKAVVKEEMKVQSPRTIKASKAIKALC